LEGWVEVGAGSVLTSRRKCGLGVHEMRGRASIIEKYIFDTFLEGFDWEGGLQVFSEMCHEKKRNLTW